MKRTIAMFTVISMVLIILSSCNINNKCNIAFSQKVVHDDPALFSVDSQDSDAVSYTGVIVTLQFVDDFICEHKIIADANKTTTTTEYAAYSYYIYPND